MTMLLAFAGTAFAQGLSIDITDGSSTADPIAVVPFAFEGAGLPPETDVSEIVRADLARSGKFFTLGRRDIIEFPTRESEVKFATWRMLKQNYLVVGRLADAGDGALRVEFELFDVARQSRMMGLAISGQRTAMRDVAHQIARKPNGLFGLLKYLVWCHAQLLLHVQRGSRNKRMDACAIRTLESFRCPGDITVIGP